MSEFIDRHYESPEVFLDNVSNGAKERGRLIPLLERSSSVAGSILNAIKVEALTHLAVDSRAMEEGTWNAWTTYMEVAESIFAMSRSPKGDQVERVIDKKSRTLTGTGVTYFAGAGNWLDAYFLARSCRDEPRLEFLCNVPVEEIRQAQEAGGFEYDEYVYFWVSVLQDYTLDRPTLSENLLRAFELSDPRENPDTDRDHLNKIVLPQLNAFYRAAQRNSEEFNKGIHQGLQNYRSYYTATRERSEDLNGVLPLGLLAISCIAFDLGGENSDFNPEFNSDYLPDHIIMRIWERRSLS